MEKIEFQLNRIASALEVIARTLDKSYTPESTASEVIPASVAMNYKTHAQVTLEDELFCLTTDIYLDEAKRKAAANLKRKSGIKVSQNLIPMQIKFLGNYLPGYQIDELEGGVLIVFKDDNPKALVRFYTDLGFYRGTHWQGDIQSITSMAAHEGIPASNVFLIVLSCTNGLDNQHVCTTLNQIISNKDLLETSNMQTLKKYCSLYIDSLKIILPAPHNQVYFIAGSLHPNIAAEDIYNGSVIDLTTNNWLSTPLNSIVSIIKTL